MFLQASAVLFFAISIPVEVVFAQHSLHAGAAGYGGMLSAWGAGAVAGAAIYARWREHAQPVADRRRRRVSGRRLPGHGGGADAWPWRSSARLFAGMGNGVESVAVRTALQEEVEEQWMALMMSLYEALFQSVPGVGMLIGGGITALGSPRTALAVAGAGSLAITAAAWFALAGSGSAPSVAGPRRSGPAEAGWILPEPARRDPALTPAVRHQ